MENNLFISSISYDETTGIARIIIDGHISVPGNCDDPIVELFRPIREKYFGEMVFTIMVKTKNDLTICEITPSNRRNRPLEEFFAVAIKTFEGDTNSNGLIAEYRSLLEKYFSDENGLKAYMGIIGKINKTNEEANKAAICNEANESIKNFVAKNGLIMPSRKKKLAPPKPAKPRKTRAEKRASSEAYKAAHPEILQKTQKPAT